MAHLFPYFGLNAAYEFSKVGGGKPEGAETHWTWSQHRAGAQEIIAFLTLQRKLSRHPIPVNWVSITFQTFKMQRKSSFDTAIFKPTSIFPAFLPIPFQNSWRYVNSKKWTRSVHFCLGIYFKKKILVQLKFLKELVWQIQSEN